MKLFFLLTTFFLCFVFSFCKSSKPYFPEKHPDLSKSEYETFINKLREKYNSVDDFEIAFYLANLKASGKLIDTHLKRAIEKKPEDACVAIFRIQRYANNRFYQTLYRHDTLTFRKAFNICLKKLGEDSFHIYMEKYHKSVQENQKLKSQIDSNKMDINLMETLEEIYTDDQKYRKKIDILNKSEEENSRYFVLQEVLDSTNLLKVDSIINTIGCTKPEVVGYDLAMTIFFVLHHQTDINVRERYRYFIEDCYQGGTLHLYDKGTSDL